MEIDSCCQKDSHMKDVYTKLLNLDLSIASAKAVDDIIGNNYYTTYTCACCMESVAESIEGFENDSCESYFICFDCVREMFTLISKRGF